jgi:acyl-CoA dehydrogenase
MEAATPEEETTASDGGGAPPAFSLELSEDQKDIRDWVHGFAEQTVRPAAAEWDERE